MFLIANSFRRAYLAVIVIADASRLTGGKHRPPVPRAFTSVSLPAAGKDWDENIASRLPVESRSASMSGGAARTCPEGPQCFTVFSRVFPCPGRARIGMKTWGARAQRASSAPRYFRGCFPGSSARRLESRRQAESAPHTVLRWRALCPHLPVISNHLTLL